MVGGMTRPRDFDRRLFRAVDKNSERILIGVDAAAAPDPLHRERHLVRLAVVGAELDVLGEKGYWLGGLNYIKAVGVTA
jgi:hypothetical protein